MFTIAWDAKTQAITYLFTSDKHFIGDSELSVGGLCRLVGESEKPYEFTYYTGWLITSEWGDNARDLSGDAIWHVALRRDAAHPLYGTIVGFVQSRYLKIPRG